MISNHSETALFEFGGSTWESNPPKRLLTPQTGFEDQRTHQHPSTPKRKDDKLESYQAIVTYLVKT